MTTLKQIIANKTVEVQQVNSELTKLNNIQTAINNLCSALDDAPEYLAEGLEAIQHRLAEYGNHTDIPAFRPKGYSNDVKTSEQRNNPKEETLVKSEPQKKNTGKNSWMQNLKVMTSVAEVAKPDMLEHNIGEQEINDPFAPDSEENEAVKTHQKSTKKSSWMSNIGVMSTKAQVSQDDKPKNEIVSKHPTIPIGATVYHEVSEIQGEVVAADVNGIPAKQGFVWVKFTNKWITSLTHFQFKIDELKIVETADKK